MNYNDDGFKYLIIQNYYGPNTEMVLCQLFNDKELLNQEKNKSKYNKLLQINNTNANGINIVLTPEDNYKVIKELESQNEYGEFHRCILTAESIIPVMNNSTYVIVTLENKKMGIYDFSKEEFITPLFDDIKYSSRLPEEISKGVLETTTHIHDEESNYESELISYIYYDGTFATPVFDLASEKYFDTNDEDFDYDYVEIESKRFLKELYDTRKANALKLIKKIKK